MERSELIEWVVIILCIVAWWPLVFLNFGPSWYRLLLYGGEPVAMLIILVRRFRRMKAGLEYSEQVARSQVPGRPDAPPAERK